MVSRAREARHARPIGIDARICDTLLTELPGQWPQISPHRAASGSLCGNRRSASQADDVLVPERQQDLNGTGGGVGSGLVSAQGRIDGRDSANLNARNSGGTRSIKEMEDRTPM